MTAYLAGQASIRQFLGIMHFMPDSDDPHGIGARLLAALPSGSYLAIQHPRPISIRRERAPRAPTAAPGSPSGTGAGKSSPASLTAWN
jgi:hypothetical protein